MKDGNKEFPGTLTKDVCIDYCQKEKTAYAGLQYGFVSLDLLSGYKMLFNQKTSFNFGHDYISNKTNHIYTQNLNLLRGERLNRLPQKRLVTIAYLIIRESITASTIPHPFIWTY